MAINLFVLESINDIRVDQHCELMKAHRPTFYQWNKGVTGILKLVCGMHG